MRKDKSELEKDGLLAFENSRKIHEQNKVYYDERFKNHIFKVRNLVYV